MIINELINKAIILAQSGKIEEAKGIFNNLLENYPDSYILLSAVGLFYVNIGDFNNASISFFSKKFSLSALAIKFFISSFSSTN